MGENGAGKTNLLEALHLGTQGYSLRTRQEGRAVRFGAPSARVEVAGATGGGVPFEADVTVDAAGGKRIRVDGATVAGAEPLRRRFPVLAFTPDRLAVVKGGPAVRRTYLDRTLGRTLPARSSVPAEYAQALAQRNAALRRVRDGLSSPRALAPWDETLVALAGALEDARTATVAALARPFAGIASALGLEAAELRYDSEPLTAEMLAARLERDVGRGVTTAGPHLRDLGIEAGGRELRAFGSQGEQRLAVLALLIAEAVVLEDVASEPPVLLLDDVLSELDGARRLVLVRCIPAGCQTFVTATSLRALPESVEPSAVIDVVPGRAARR